MIRPVPKPLPRPKVKPKRDDPNLRVSILVADRLRIECRDCAHFGYLERDLLVKLDEAGCKTFGQLGDKLQCKPCYKAGGLGKSVSIQALSNDPTRKAIRL